jgi:two-component system, NarL family, sensor histidine kinase BarA
LTELGVPRSLDELTMGEAFAIEDLVSRAGLGELLTSVHDLFGIPLRVFGSSGVLLADAGETTPALHSLLGTKSAGRRVVNAVIQAVKQVDVREGIVESASCPSGMRYAVAAITYDGRRIGRIIAGPFVPSELVEPPVALFEIEPELDPEQLRTAWSGITRASSEMLGLVIRHLAATLDLVLFSGYRALLASNMHLASVRESYRELQEKNSRLEQAYERLKELDRLKSNFLATVSHELRTPLTSIIGYSEMLTAGIAGELTGEQREFIETIQEKGAQLLELIKGLLDLTKLESGTLILRKSETQIAPILTDIVDTLAPQAQRKGVELFTELESSLPTVWGEPARLRQVFLNLAENAIKFTPTEGRVRLSARAVLEEVTDDDGPMVVLRGARRTVVEVRVTDTGIGIPAAERERVFDAFYQVDSSSTREQGGTGLGLSIVKRLVEAHEGTVRIESGEPEGTVFVVVLPCKRLSMFG